MKSKEFKDWMKKNGWILFMYKGNEKYINCDINASYDEKTFCFGYSLIELFAIWKETLTNPQGHKK